MQKQRLSKEDATLGKWIEEVREQPTDVVVYVWLGIHNLLPSALRTAPVVEVLDKFEQLDTRQKGRFARRVEASVKKATREANVPRSRK